VKFSTRKSRAGAGASRTRLTDCTPIAVGPPLSTNVTGVGNDGDGGGSCVSVNTGSHWTAGTVSTYTEVPEHLVDPEHRLFARGRLARRCGKPSDAELIDVRREIQKDQRSTC